MRERLTRVTDRLVGSADASPPTRLTALRAAAAELLIATTIEAAYDRLRSGRRGSESGVPLPLAWAPLIIAPLAALAHIQHARQPADGTVRALRLLNSATVAVGGALLLYEFTDSSHSPRRLGPLGLASAGLLGFAIDRQEREIHTTEDELRRRAKVVERLVPKRRARLDRIVVHV